MSSSPQVFPHGSSRAPREVLIVVYPGVQSLDLTGPLEVFAGAQLLIEGERRRAPGYRVRVLSRDGAPLATSSGLTIVPDGSLHETTASANIGTGADIGVDAHVGADANISILGASTGIDGSGNTDALAGIDTLIVAGGYGSREATADPELIDWLARVAPKARRVASVCTGAFLLAQAGLLDGRRATTHWASAEELARRYPAVAVDPEPIFLRDGNVWTSAGVTAGMDLALALVEQDHGRELALAIARHLVLFLRRPGNQSQFSATLATQQPLREPLREAQRHALENPGADLSVEAMAARAHMSPRHFARSFRAEVGITPARYVEQVRLEAARRRLEDTPEPVASVAASCGFGTPETMRRVFLRALGVGPAEYRRRFHTSIAQATAVA